MKDRERDLALTQHFRELEESLLQPESTQSFGTLVDLSPTIRRVRQVRPDLRQGRSDGGTPGRDTVAADNGDSKSPHCLRIQHF